MTNPTLNIDPELKSFLPALDRETKAILTDSIKRYGRAIHPIEVWKGKNIIVDGHNRYEICMAENLPFTVVELEFKDKDDVKKYMLMIQGSRRNYTKDQASLYRGMYMKILRIKVKTGEVKINGKTTAQKAAEDTGVSEATIKRDASYADGVAALEQTDPTEASKVKTGKSKLNKSTVEALGKAKTPAAKAKVTAKMQKEKTRTHKKQAVSKPKKETPPVVNTKPDIDRDEETDKLIESMGFFLTASSVNGRKAMMQKVVESMSLIEGKTFEMPEEYR